MIVLNQFLPVPLALSQLTIGHLIQKVNKQVRNLWVPANIFFSRHCVCLAQVLKHFCDPWLCHSHWQFFTNNIPLHKVINAVHKFWQVTGLENKMKQLKLLNSCNVWYVWQCHTIVSMSSIWQRLWTRQYMIFNKTSYQLYFISRNKDTKTSFWQKTKEKER